MAIIARNDGGDFTPAPEGRFSAVCCDVIDLGLLDVTWLGQIKKQHKIVISFQLDEIDPDSGKPWLVSQRFTLSLHEKATLRRVLQSWRGRAFTEQEITDGFDVERLLNANADLQIIHATRNEKVYANIDTIMKPAKGAAVLKVHDYVRVKDRPAKDGNGAPQNGGTRPQSAPAVSAGSGIRGGRVEDALRPRAAMQPANVQDDDDVPPGEYDDSGDLSDPLPF